MGTCAPAWQPDEIVPVLILDVDETEADKILATLDPLAAMATTDKDALAQLLAGVQTDSEALQAMLDEMVGVSSDWKDREDSVPEIIINRAKPGDIWRLGDHRLMCGDSTNLADVLALMNGRKAALFHTDPPYLVDYNGADRPSHGKDWSGVYHEVDIKDAAGFFRGVFAAGLEVCEPDAAWYCWHAHKRAALIEQVWAELGVLNHQQIIWVKPTTLHGFAYYPWRHEPCLMGWRQGHKPVHDGKNDGGLSSVWELDWEGKARVVGNEHPTQKPVELFAIPMRKHTQRGGLCYEPFSGSGSQLVAGEREGRTVYAMEIEPRFVDVAIGRWEQLTGKTAVLEVSGPPDTADSVPSPEVEESESAVTV